MIVRRGFNTVMIGSIEGHGICQLTGTVALKNEVAMFNGGIDKRLSLICKRLCHMNTKTIEQIIRHNVVESLDKYESSKVNGDVFQGCFDGNQTEVPHPLRDKKPREILELIFFDIMGPTRVAPLSRSRYV